MGCLNYPTIKKYGTIPAGHDVSCFYIVIEVFQSYLHLLESTRPSVQRHTDLE